MGMRLNRSTSNEPSFAAMAICFDALSIAAFRHGIVSTNQSNSLDDARGSILYRSPWSRQ